MTWVLAQAGNRASKTRPYLQWWVNESEQDVRSSALQNLHYSASLIYLLLIALLGRGSLESCVSAEPAADRGVWGNHQEVF